MITSTAKRRALAIVTTAAVLAIGLSGCVRGSGQTADATSASSPGITDDSILIGSTSPLTGNAAGVGQCSVDGAIAYFGKRNAEGGIAFGDGKTRRVEMKAYDNGYDPQKALANFQQMTTDGVFAAALSLGTPTNRAWREAAISQGVPQVLVVTGDPLFSDREQSPWQLGLVPTYPQEGEAFGKLLAESGTKHSVAILSQNDDYGKGYVEGLKSAIKGADNITIVKELTYEATDNDVSAQITELAATNADIFFNAMSSLAPLVLGSLQQANAVGWHPSWFLPSTTSSPSVYLTPSGVAQEFPAIYTVASSVSAGSPGFSDSPAGKEFLAALGEYTAQDGVPGFPQCVWSWIGASILEQAFTKMTEPTRASFMKALRSISGFEAPFLLPGGTIDTTKDRLPAMSDVVVQQFNGTGFTLVEKID